MKNITILLILLLPWVAFAQEINKPVAMVAKSNSLSMQTLLLKNSSNQLDSIYSFKFYSPVDSLLNGETYYTYDSLDRKIIEMSFLHNNAADPWKGNYKNEYTYDSVGNTATCLPYMWIDTLYTWYYYELYKYVYNSNRKLVSKLLYYTNYTNQPIFRLWLKDNYSYDSSGNQITDTSYQYIEGGFYPQLIEEYSYNSHGNIMSDKQSTIETPSFQWLCSEYNKYEYTYNSLGKIDTLLQYYYSFETNKWINTLKVVYSYNFNGQLASYIYQIWDTITNQLTNTDYIEYTYDSNGNKILETGYLWNENGNQWDLFNKKYFYYHVMSPVEINTKTSLSETPFMLFPNPAHDKVSIEIYDRSIKSASLYTTHGQLVKIFTIQAGLNSLNLSDISIGVYIIQVPTPKHIFTQKLIKQ